MGRAARDLGFEFAAQGSSTVLQRLQGFPLLHSGSHVQAPNLMMKKGADDRLTLIYDFHFRAGTGPRRTVLGTTVLHFVSPQLNLPQFSLWPQNVLTRGLQRIAGRDIDFENRPRFSKAHWLRGEDEEAIRKLFDGEPIRVLDSLGQSGSKPCVEGRGTDIIIYHHFRRAQPQRLAALIQEGEEIMAAFEHAQRR